MSYSQRYGTYNSIWYIIIITLLFFILSLPFPELIGILGLRPSNVLAAPWTLITTMFMHGGFWHIFANMLTFYFFGSFLSRVVGERGFLFVYFVGGLVGSLFFVLLAPSNAIAVGASGGVYALGGALMVLMPRLRVFVLPIPIPLPLWVVIIGGFLLALTPGIAWQAHLGGLLFGLLAGFYFRRRRRGYTVY